MFCVRLLTVMSLLLTSALAQYPGTATTYPNDPPDTSTSVDIDPVGANYNSAPGSSGSVKVNGVLVSGVLWVRLGNSLWIYANGDYIGTIHDYFDPEIVIHIPTDGGAGYDVPGGALFTERLVDSL